MANRSYLYSIDFMPEPNLSKKGKKITGISEWNYGIPIIYKILLSGQPQTCNSLIWDEPEGIALIGSYDQGLSNLKKFFTRIDLPEAQKLIDEALGFLEHPDNKNKYFLLECGEIFDIDMEPSIPEQNLLLLDEIKNINPKIEIALQSLVPPKIEEPTPPLGFFEKIFGKRAVPEEVPEYDQSQALHSLGFGNWTNVLYFSFDNV